jgi:hypothetical protein
MAIAGIAAGAVVLIVLVVASIALSGGGGGDPRPTPTQALPTSSVPTSSSPTSSPTAESREFDAAFVNTTLRDYVRPYYSQIASCEKQTDNAGASSAKCVFDDGHQAIFFGLPTTVTMAAWRSTLSDSLSQLDGADKGTWAKGAKWTNEQAGGAYLYWDEESAHIGGLVIDTGGTVSGLDTWWLNRWGKG